MKQRQIPKDGKFQFHLSLRSLILIYPDIIRIIGRIGSYTSSTSSPLTFWPEGFSPSLLDYGNKAEGMCVWTLKLCTGHKNTCLGALAADKCTVLSCFALCDPNVSEIRNTSGLPQIRPWLISGSAFEQLKSRLLPRAELTAYGRDYPRRRYQCTVCLFCSWHVLLLTYAGSCVTLVLFFINLGVWEEPQSEGTQMQDTFREASFHARWLQFRQSLWKLGFMFVYLW